MIPTALTIAGSDPSGGAGILADLKTFSALKVYGMSATTALTVQNTAGVSRIFSVPPEVVGAQIDAVAEDIRPGAAKTGMLSGRATVEVVAERIERHRIDRLVVDPVLSSSSGTPLLEAAALAVVRSRLLPLALVLTPNLDEAEVLAGFSVRTPEKMEEAARAIHGMGARHVLVKGGHLEGDAVVDVFFDGAAVSRFPGARIRNRDAHGTGCVLSAAIAGFLAIGLDVERAVSRGRDFTRSAIERGLRLGRGAGPCDPLGLT